MIFILLFVVLIVVGVLILAMTKPNEFRVTRSIVLAAPVDAVFAQVNDIRKGHEWSPWVEMEPDAKYTFEGGDAGVGASVHWEGKKTGKGTMTIIDVKPMELVRSRLDFYKPMVATNTAEFILEPEGDGRTKLTWTMYGPNKFMGKVMSVFMNCEKMIGGSFEKGLSNLKNIVEK